MRGSGTGVSASAAMCGATGHHRPERRPVGGGESEVVGGEIVELIVYGRPIASGDGELSEPLIIQHGQWEWQALDRVAGESREAAGGRDGAYPGRHTEPGAVEPGREPIGLSARGSQGDVTGVERNEVVVVLAREGSCREHSGDIGPHDAVASGRRRHAEQGPGWPGTEVGAPAKRIEMWREVGRGRGRKGDQRPPLGIVGKQQPPRSTNSKRGDVASPNGAAHEPSLDPGWGIEK